METTDTQPAPEAQAPLQALQSQIRLLTELNERVDGLRQSNTFLRAGITPPALSAGGVLPTAQPSSLRQGFEQLKELAEKVQSESVQEALKAAKESESKDGSNLLFGQRNRRIPK